MIPSKAQWKSWSLPSKLTAIGTLVAVFSLVLYVTEKSFDVVGFFSASLDASASCTITTTVSSDIVARVYARARLSREQVFGPGKQTFPLTSQELFYEWKVALVSNAPAKDITFELHNLREGDRVSLQPPSVGTVSKAFMHWLSGLPEPSRRKPDYFIRTVLLPNLSPESPSTFLLVRRPLDTPSIAPGPLIRVENPQSANCIITRPEAGSTGDKEYLRSLAVKLAGNVYKMAGEAGVPLKPDPGDVGEEEVQVTIELRCEDENCESMKVGQPVARMGKTPHEHETELAREKLQSLKKDLEPILGCVRGPEADPDPSHDSQYIEYCGNQLPLSPEDMRRLIDVFQAHGTQVTLKKISR